MLFRFFANMSYVAFLTTFLLSPIQAQQPAGTNPNNSAAAKEIAARQEFLKQQWNEFSKNLLQLAQRLDKSERQEDKDKAKTLRKALEVAEKEGVDNKFTALLRTLSKSGDVPLAELNTAANQNQELVKVLRMIVDILLNDDELTRIREEKERLQKLLNQLKGIIKDQKINRALTENGKTDPKDLSQEQKEIANRTDNLAKSMGDKSGGKSDAKEDPKGENKGEGENKSEGKGDNKNDTGDAKGNEKNSKPSGGEGAENQPKKGNGSEEGSEGGSKKGGPPMEGAEGSGKPQPKSGDTNSKENKPSESKNQGDNKGEQKPGDASQGGDSKGQGSQPQPGQQGGGKSGGQQGQPQQGGGQQDGGQQNQQDNNQAPGADQVKKAVPDQNDAADQLQKKKNENAAQKQDEAIEKLVKAQEELEKRLKQLREEELERLLANLEARVNRMLSMQKEVYENTKALYQNVQKSEDKKLPKADYQKAQQMADREGEIIAEADKTIDLLRSEGSAVAFPQVMEEVRKDMFRVKERLVKGMVDLDTQMIEEDIIKALEEMLLALKKAQQDLKSEGGGGGGGGSNPNKKLLDDIAELKIIRSLQEKVNRRTTTYGKRYEGEQADDQQIRSELKDLSERQIKIEQMVKDLASGKNK